MVEGVMSPAELESAENQAILVEQEIQKINYEMHQIEEVVNDLSSNSVYFGKTMPEWADYFSIEFSPNATPQDIKTYASMMNERTNVAFKNRILALRKKSEYEKYYTEQKNKLIEAQVNNRSRKTVPAAETLDKAAESQLGTHTVMLQKFQNGVDFWQSVIYKLKDNFNLLNLLAMSNGTLARIERTTT